MTFLFLPNRGIFAEFNAYKVKLPIVYQGIPWKKKKRLSLLHFVSSVEGIHG